MKFNLFIIGIALIFLGIFLIIYSSLSYNKDTEFGFIGLIGPFPIIITSSKEILPILIAFLLLTILILFLLIFNL